MKVCVECGQRWWRPSCWRRTPSTDNLLRFRKFPAGFAFGPIMFVRGVKK